MKFFNTFITIMILFSLNSALGQKLAPGNWKATAKFKLAGIPLPSNEQTECIRAKDSKNLKSVVSEALKKNGCILELWKIKKQKLDAKLKCKNDDLDAEGTFTGTVQNKKYDLNGTAEGLYKSNIPAKAEFILSGEWTGPCEK